jgi:transposase-like protein
MEKEKQGKKDEKQQQISPKKRTYRAPSTSHTSQQKSEAVLAVWSERRSPSQVCREMGIKWTILNQWQERALEGMLQALEPRRMLDNGPALSPRLQALLSRKQASFSARKLAQRLKEIQEPAVSSATTEG